MMQLSAPGAAFIRTEEGYVAHWYADPVGVGTIGVGFTWASSSFRSWWAAHRPGAAFGPGATMTRDEADQVLLMLVADEYGAAVSRFLGHDVAQHVYDGMCSPVFNCGAGTLSDAWAGAVRAGNLHLGATELRTTRVTAKGVLLRGLQNRRIEEAQLIELGDYTIGNLATAKPATSPVLFLGEHGTEVADLQHSLVRLGLYSGTVDGRFGFGTQAAVLAFQRAHGLTADGRDGPLTDAAIRAA